MCCFLSDKTLNRWLRLVWVRLPYQQIMAAPLAPCSLQEPLIDPERQKVILWSCLVALEERKSSLHTCLCVWLALLHPLSVASCLYDPVSVPHMCFMCSPVFVFACRSAHLPVYLCVSPVMSDVLGVRQQLRPRDRVSEQHREGKPCGCGVSDGVREATALSRTAASRLPHSACAGAALRPKPMCIVCLSVHCVLLV